MLAELAREARADGAAALTGAYRPTARNTLVREHYARLGFAQTGEGPDGATHWRLDLAAYRAPDLPFRIERSA